MLAIGLGGVLLLPKPAKADNPIFAAVIVAGAGVQVALISGAGMVTAALITTYGGGGSGGGGNAGGGGGDDGGDEANLSDVLKSTSGSSSPIVNGNVQIEGTLDSPRQKASLGEQDLDAKVRSFVDRNVRMGLTNVRKRGLGAKVKYEFEGDVMQAGRDVASFTNGDVIEWQLEMRGPGALPFALEDLTLSTTDVPDTFGYSAMVITATQNGKTIATWQARVEQGKQPVYDKVPNEGVKVKASAGELHIDRLLLMIPVKYDANNKAQVVVRMAYEGSGQRLPTKSPITPSKG